MHARDHAPIASSPWQQHADLLVQAFIHPVSNWEFPGEQRSCAAALTDLLQSGEAEWDELQHELEQYLRARFTDVMESQYAVLPAVTLKPHDFAQCTVEKISTLVTAELAKRVRNLQERVKVLERVNHILRRVYALCKTNLPFIQ